ncbi:MAG: hypothetical protein H6713_37630 [Myxococcales bacterium]|nr:hypothetical protein [Myxococcales bacterium]MCB9755687.1 hypothetical protein [Myxococcales bacterium]
MNARTVFGLGCTLALAACVENPDQETESDTAATTNVESSTSGATTSDTSSSSGSTSEDASTSSTSVEPTTSGTTATPTTSGTTTGTSETTENVSDPTTMGDPCEEGATPECCEVDPEFPDCAPTGCLAPEAYVQCDQFDMLEKGDGLAPFNALGLGCPGTDASNGVVITDYAFQSDALLAWQITRGFGNYHINNDPQAPLLYNGQSIPKLDENDKPIEGEYILESDTILLLSTGELPDPDNGYITGLGDQAGNGENNNPDNPNELPSPMADLCGSNGGQCGTPFEDCDGENDCSDTITGPWEEAGGNPNDKLWFEFTADVPQETTGYSFRLAFWTSEWPNFVNLPEFNDIFIGWQVSEAYTGNTIYMQDPDDANKVVSVNVTTLDPYFADGGFACLPKFAPNCAQPPALSGTGFSKHAGTNWLTVRAPVVAGEQDVQFGFFIADMNDSLFATTVALDSWHWECEGCTLGAPGSCGVLFE